MTRGEKVVAFIEAFCINPEGDHVGKPMRLVEFQKRFILEVYDNPFHTHTAILSMARKNGKTTLIASLLLAHLCGPEAVRNSQIASGAQSKDQAAVVFQLARKMVEMSPRLLSVVHVHPSGKRLTGIRQNVLYEALAAEGKTAHGKSPVLVILDEVGQVEGPSDKFVDALTTAQGAYENALLIAISTQAPSDADMFSVWIDAQKSAPDPRVVCHVYAAPEECEMDDRTAWAAANPGLGYFRSLSDVEKQAKRALEMPANENSFRNLILNQRVNVGSPFVTQSIWRANGEAPGEIAGTKVYGGLDLSAVNDLTALTLVSAESGAVHCAFWLPEYGLSEKSRKDRVPYDIWKKQGHLLTTPGKAIEYEHVAEYLRGVFDRCDVQAIGFDRYNMKFLKPWLVKAGFTDTELTKFVEFGQGTASMTPALRELEVWLLESRLRHGNHPILTMCAVNAVVVGDSGARKFEKDKARGRIDGMVALAMSVGVMPQEATQPPTFQSFVLG